MTITAAPINKSNSIVIIEEARQIAREVICETWPTATEIAEPAKSMFEFDTICIDSDECKVSSIAIMHDPDAETFALVEESQPAPLKESCEPKSHEPLPAWPIDWNRLKQGHEIAFLRGDLATSSPESYTIDEMREISEAMSASTAEVEAALRTDFNSMTPYAQGRMLELLKQADSNNYDFWLNLLVGNNPNGLAQVPISK